MSNKWQKLDHAFSNRNLVEFSTYPDFKLILTCDIFLTLLKDIRSREEIPECIDSSIIIANKLFKAYYEQDNK